jgi:hypothetical protein
MRSSRIDHGRRAFLPTAEESPKRSGRTTAARSSLDAVAVHPYGYPLSTQFVDDYAKARSAFPTTPVWTREFSMNDEAVPGRWAAAQHDSIQMAEIAIRP